VYFGGNITNEYNKIFHISPLRYHAKVSKIDKLASSLKKWTPIAAPKQYLKKCPLLKQLSLN
jgi:hypothetical protein